MLLQLLRQRSNSRRMNQPGTDQAIVQGAMVAHRRRRVLDWSYLPDQHVVLIDKVFKFETTAIELGGEVWCACRVCMVRAFSLS
jgi:hypothetical protein